MTGERDQACGRLLTAAAAIATCFAAAFAGWAACESQKSVREAHMSVLEAAKATRAGVLLQVITEYGSSEMFNSIQSLRAWQQDYPRSPEIALKALFLKENRTETDSARYKEVAGSLRRVSNFFEKVKVISEQKLIDEELLPSLWECSVYKDTIAKLVIPMNLARVDGLVEKKLLDTPAIAEARRLATAQLSFYRRLLCPNEK